MNKVASVIFMFFISFSALAQRSELFDESPTAKILDRSKNEKKPVLYMIHASWCPHCHKMKDEVFTKPEIAEFLTKNFVCASQNGETTAGKSLMRKYEAISFPTFLLLDENGTLLYSFGGEFKPDAFIKELNNALTPENQFPKLEAAFSQDPTDGEKCYAYVAALRKARLDASTPAKKYLATQSDAALVSGTNWKIIANGITDIDSREFRYVLAHQKEFAAVSSSIRVERKILNMVTELLRPLSDRQDTIAYKKLRPLAKSIKMHKTDSLIFQYDLRIWERSADWKSYQKTTVESVRKFYWNEPEKLKDIASVYVKNINEKPALEFATSLAARSLELKEAYDGYLLMAKLYEKTKNKDKALEYAAKAKDFASRMKFNTKEADELLNRLI